MAALASIHVRHRPRAFPRRVPLRSLAQLSEARRWLMSVEFVHCALVRARQMLLGLTNRRARFWRTLVYSTARRREVDETYERPSAVV